jgi:hypothetical protein
MPYGQLMRDILRFIYLIMAPTAIVTGMFGMSAFTTPIVHPKDQLREKITASARKFESMHPWFKSDSEPLTLFNGYFFIASKPILKGEIIQAASLEREPWDYKSKPVSKLSKQVIVHCVAARNIAKEQLIAPADLVASVSGHDSAVDLDDAVKTAGAETHLPKIWDTSAFLILGAGFCVWLYGVAALHILAFKKSLVWGLSSVFLPFASAVFKLQNWRRSRKFFHVTLVGCGLMSFAAVMLIADLTMPIRL